MKVLFVAKYVYEPTWDGFNKCCTGYGLMVRQIEQGISKNNQVCILTNAFTKMDSEEVPSHTICDVLKNAQFKDWKNAICSLFEKSDSLKERIKKFYLELNRGYIRKVYDRFRPDIIHIHGISAELLPYIKEAENIGAPILVTSHGLIGLNQSMVASAKEKKFERDFFRSSSSSKQYISVLSSGMKERICKEYLQLDDADNIIVIPNGIDMPKRNIDISEVASYKNIGIVVDNEGVLNAGLVKSLNEHIDNERLVLFTKTENVEALRSNISKANLLCTVDVASSDEICYFDQLCKEVNTAYVIGKSNSDYYLYRLSKQHVTIYVECRYESIFKYQTTPSMEINLEDCHLQFTKVENSKIASSAYDSGDISRNLAECCQFGSRPDRSMVVDAMALLKCYGASIGVYVANITNNKNQIQAVRAIKKLIDENLYLFLFGREADKGHVREYIAQNNLWNRVFLVGFNANPEWLWQFADFNLFLSKNDGFGLAVAEGLIRGVPSVMFSDLDAFEDLYCKSGVVPVDTRSDEEVAKAIKISLCRQWNFSQIKEDGSKHSNDVMLSNYNEVYRRLVIDE